VTVLKNDKVIDFLAVVAKTAKNFRGLLLWCTLQLSWLLCSVWLCCV